MLELVTAPIIEPVTYAQVIHHLRMNSFDEAIDESSQEYLNRLIAAVREGCEAFTNRAFVTQTWKMYLHEFPAEDYIEIYHPPLQSVTHVKYTEEDGTENTWDADYYTVDMKSVKGRIVLNPGYEWPTETLFPSNPIEIQFICGYGSEATDVPAAIRHAILVQVGDLWDNREDFKEKGLSRPSEILLWPYRVFW